jgi:hypothetical protein
MTADPASDNAPVSIDMTGLEYAQVSAVLDHLQSRDVYFEQLDNVITVPTKFEREVRDLIEHNRTRSALDYYAIVSDPNFIARSRLLYGRLPGGRTRRVGGLVIAALTVTVFVALLLRLVFG